MPGEKTGGANTIACILDAFEKYQQLIHRHAPAFIRHVLEGFRQHTLNAAQATGQLGLSRSRLYALATAYNTARARKPFPALDARSFRWRSGPRVAAARP